jgi:hypothetical protein
VGLFEDPTVAFRLLNSAAQFAGDEGLLMRRGSDVVGIARRAWGQIDETPQGQAPHVKIERARWLELIGSVAAFPSGLVAVSAMPQDLVPVEIVVTSDEFVVARPGPDDLPEEIGRIRRDAVQGLDVVDEAGSAVPRAASDTIEEDALCRVGLRWRDGAGKDQEDSFLFRAPSVAWETADRILRFATTAA